MALKRFRVEKLIRDHLPDIMRNKGILVYERVMEQDEFIAKLKDKLQEEAGEVKHAKDENELTEELADMLEVIYALSKATGIPLVEQIEKMRPAKQKTKGGFDRKIYNPYVDIEEANPSIDYYLKKAEHYPLEEVYMQASPEKSKFDFAVIYRSYLKPGRESDYQNSWQIVAQYFIKHRGAIGSCLHRTADGMWVAYSRWPDQKTRDASWPGENAPSDELPQEIREAVVTLQECLDPDRKLPDICMEVVNDLLLNELDSAKR